MSGSNIPNAMPQLPRLTSPANLLGWASQLCNAIELQMRRLLATPAISNVPQVGQSATGTTRGTAFQITSDYTEFTTVAAGGTAQVPATVGWGLVVNGGANTLTLYGPPPAGTINGGASITISAGNQAIWSVSTSTTAIAH